MRLSAKTRKPKKSDYFSREPSACSLSEVLAFMTNIEQVDRLTIPIKTALSMRTALEQRYIDGARPIFLKATLKPFLDSWDSRIQQCTQ
jgi:hypothetical protein